jgi:hypothetical protein
VNKQIDLDLNCFSFRSVDDFGRLRNRSELQVNRQGEYGNRDAKANPCEQIATFGSR